ncbi:helix-turn-helix domain-containing protein [Oleiharenicola lentus]|jgi:AraC family transcriptional regulator|uniref:Helix-turn-helix domain-containing protein n=1 Tax=Oleiharenicola lentus TaxID=2508720 RepID=A0A4V1M5V7_9BACT|nr:helix-turn-helix domain-containing protein [Oleiharenicola lentus]RXK52856.1 helix-turn-helix domain-containing protein [Oleiharenicola lentus]
MTHYRQAVLRSLDVIEQHLKCPLALHALARRAGFSLWHFHRVFTEHTGDTLGCYLRKRRLTAAAEELARTDRTVLAIALDYQFESHEAFTRAFKVAFGSTPREFRRTGQLAWLRTRPELTPARLQALPVRTTMKPALIELPALHLLGLSVRFMPPMSPTADNLQVIPDLYHRFCPLIPTLPPMLDKFIYGAARYPADGDRPQPDEREYLASIRVSPGTKAKPPLSVWKIPAGTYACFTHRGPMAQFGETMNYAFGTWLPRSKYTHADTPNLDRQDERFGDGGKECEFDFLMPVRPK